jgi:hypothetical protein
MKAGMVGWVKGSFWFGSWVGRNIVRLIHMTNNRASAIYEYIY